MAPGRKGNCLTFGEARRLYSAVDFHLGALEQGVSVRDVLSSAI